MIDPYGDDMVDPDLESQLREHYEAQYRRYGDAPTAQMILARMAPTIAAASSSTRQRRTPYWRILPRGVLPARAIGWRAPRLAILGALVVVAVLTGAATFAVASGLVGVFIADPGAGVVHQQQLGQTVHLAQTIDGETVTIDWVYADANRILIQYTVPAPSGRGESCGMLHGNTTLTDAAGQRYAGLPESAVPPVLPSNRQDPSACLLSFDASPVVGAPSVLMLHLAIGPLCSSAPSSVQTQPTFAAQANALPRVVTQCQPSTAGGPIVFHLKVPFYGGQVITLHERAIADGKAVTLDRVVVAPSETRLYFEGLDANWVTLVHIAVNGKSLALTGGSGYLRMPSRQAGSETAYDVLAPLSGQHGHAVVTMRAQLNWTPTGPVGPAVWATWTFPFQL